VSYLGYEKKVFTGIKVEKGQMRTLNIPLGRSSLTFDQEVVIIGDKPLVDIEQTRTEQRVSQDAIEAAPVRQLQGVLNTQAGVVLNPEGVSIRGGRTYETAFIIDGVSATDPLAGTGFGIDLGITTYFQLAEAASVLRRRHLERLMRDGVSVIDPAQTYVDVDVQVGVDTTLLPGTILEGTTRIGAGAVVGPSCHLTDCEIGDAAVVHSTRAEGAHVGAGVHVGPFAHLRPGTVLEAGARVGAFVQTKNSRVGAGAKVPHLAYVGDADVGAGANVACGVVTVNYDGREKHRTVIGEGAFVGCGTMLVAPVEVGAGAYVAAGSTITDDVPPEALAIGRARQVVKEGRARGRLG
jgi:acetyltransferase-like isoleucine patch superfamily enzyme